MRNRILPGLTTATMLLAGGIALVAAALWPLAEEATPPDAARDVSAAADAGGPAGDPLPLASFARAWSVDLRRPLTEGPQPTAAPPAGGAAGGLQVRLVGTILDPSRPRGIFLTPLGQTELKAAGEKVAGVEVLRVEERSATLSIAGRPVTIKLEKVEPVMPANPDPAQPPSARAATGK